MTKKENLFYELMKVQNEVCMKENGRPYKADVEEYITTTTFRKKADQLTMKKLEEEMENWSARLEKIRAAEAIEAWKLTEEGKAYIQERKDQMDALRNEWKNIMTEGENHAREIVRNLLGEQWDVTSFSDRRMEIAIIDKYDEDGHPHALFGHDFAVYYDHLWNGGGYEWLMNYGTMGSFELTKDSTRIQLLFGMAKFASDTTVIPELRDYLHAMAEKIKEVRRQYCKVEQEMKAPKVA